MSLLKAPWFRTKRPVKPGAFFIALESFHEPLPYQVKVHQRRRRVSIEISQGQVCVKTPVNCSQEMVERFITQQQHWLADKLANATHNAFSRQYQSGEPIFLLGEEYRLSVSRGFHSTVVINEETQTIEVIVSQRTKHLQQAVRKLLREFYVAQAEQTIPKLVAKLEQTTQLQTSGVDFKFYQWRWGCCYQSGQLRFNPLLMAAPLEQIECVIIHELCHLVHMNHSSKFWQLNKQFCDHCKSTKQWLKLHHDRIYLPTID